MINAFIRLLFVLVMLVSIMRLKHVWCLLAIWLFACFILFIVLIHSPPDELRLQHREDHGRPLATGKIFMQCEAILHQIHDAVGPSTAVESGEHLVDEHAREVRDLQLISRARSQIVSHGVILGAVRYHAT